MWPMISQRPKPNPYWYATKCVAFGVAIVVLPYLLVASFSETGVSPTGLTFCALYGLAFGIFVFAVSLIPPPRQRRWPEPRPPRPEHHPKDFAERLAGY